MARNPIYLKDDAGTPQKNKTGQVYEYDSGQPNNRGTLKGSITENSSLNGSYWFDTTETFNGVLVVDGSNVPEFENFKFIGGTLVGSGELTLANMDHALLEDQIYDTTEGDITIDITSYSFTDPLVEIIWKSKWRGRLKTVSATSVVIEKDTFGDGDEIKFDLKITEK
jgi:hypothetical protein